MSTGYGDGDSAGYSFDVGGYDFDAGDGIDVPTIEAELDGGVVETHFNSEADDGTSYVFDAGDLETLSDPDVVQAIAALRNGLDEDAVTLEYAPPVLPEMDDDPASATIGFASPSERTVDAYHHVRQVTNLLAHKNESLFHRLCSTVLEWLSPPATTIEPQQEEPRRELRRTQLVCPRCKGKGVIDRV